MSGASEFFTQFIKGLPTASSVGGTDSLYVLQGGVSKQLPGSALPSGGGSAVTSFNTRTGAIVPANGDYNFSNLSGSIAVNQMNGGSGASSTTAWFGDGTWKTVSGGGTPGGSSGQVQYNNSGSFGGLTNTQLTALVNQATTSLSGALPPLNGNALTFFNGAGGFTIPSGGGGTSSDFFNVKTGFGALGNGVHDDTAAIASAIAAINSAGGGILYFPPGTYACGSVFLGSNTIMMGAGMDATTIVNNGSGANFETINISWTMSGASNNWPVNNTTYPINTPSNYTNQVTLSTPANAGHFTVGKWAMVSGGLQNTSFWFPSWWAQVTAVNTGTGVVTLAEQIPFEGALLNTIQVVTAIPQNIIIRDMTLVAGLDSCVSCFGVDNMLVENVKFLPWPVGGSPAGAFSNGLCVIGQAKNSGMRNCISQAYGYELFGASYCFMDNCRCYLGQTNNNGTIQAAGTLLIDGGSSDCAITNNFIIVSPSAPATNWIEVENSPIRIKVIGNTVAGMTDGGQGISITDNAQVDNGLGNPAPFTDQNNYNIVSQNTVIGIGTPSTSIGISMSSGICTDNIIENVALGISATSTANIYFSGNQFRTISQGRFSNPEGDLGSLQNNWTQQQSFGTKTMTSGTTTPAVTGAGDYVISQSGAQNVTNFTGGRVGDVITIYFFDLHTTIVNGSGINVAGNANVTPVAGAILQFKMIDIGGGNAWYEISRTVSTTPVTT